MLHLDDELMTALLDGELPPAEAREARDHIATCGECTARFAEARGYFEEAERLVKSLEVPELSAPKLVSTPVETVPQPPRRRLPVRQLAWAASLFLAIGLGYYGNELRLRESGSPAESAKQLAPVGAVADQPAAPAEGKTSTEAVPSAPPAAAIPWARSAPAKDLAARRLKAEPAPAAANEVDRLSQDKERRQDEAANGRAAAAGQVAAPQPALAESQAHPAAAPAPQDAAAPTAPQKTDSGKLTDGVPTAAFRDTRSGLAAQSERRRAEYSAGPAKVTLEEAVHSLGGSIHLIDGLTPARVEQLTGKEVPGAMPGLPLIRVVYLDAPMRELWLDQQRGEGVNPVSDTVLLHTPDGGLSLQWGSGSDGWLSLTGHLTADSLRSLARRVR